MRFVTSVHSRCKTACRQNLFPVTLTPMRITVLQGDITREKVDAIVNAANAQLAGGGGVDGAIHRAAGPALMHECDKIRTAQGGCPTGSAVITTAGNLPCRYVIHAVGPVWRGGNNHEDELLASAYRNSLEQADAHKLRTMAFSNISTGVYGFPKQRAAEIVARVMAEFTLQVRSLEEVRFVCHDRENLWIYEQLFAQESKKS
jgi:O-acetyl-ADP-ribose deacetylase (regulator of RNase III)